VEKLRDSVAEVLRFAAFVVVYLAFQHWLPDASGFGWELAEAAGIAILSGALVLVFVELVLGQPHIRLEWLVPGSTKPSQKPTLVFKSSYGVVVRVNLHFEGSTGLARLIRSVPGLFRLHVTVTFSPSELVFLTPQHLPAGASIPSDSVLRFDLNGALPAGCARYAEITVRTIDSSVTKEQVQCQVHVRSSRLLMPGRLLARADPGIEGLSIKRS
jgi:hypothetical protein